MGSEQIGRSGLRGLGQKQQLFAKARALLDYSRVRFGRPCSGKPNVLLIIIRASFLSAGGAAADFGEGPPI